MASERIIDLGPEDGGEIVAAGTPEEIVKVKRSYTGQFLKPVLARSRRSREGAAEQEAKPRAYADESNMGTTRSAPLPPCA